MAEPWLDKDYKRVCRNIKRLVEASPKTAEKIAFEAKLSKGALSEICHGKRNPSLKTMIRVAFGLEVKLAKLFE